MIEFYQHGHIFRRSVVAHIRHTWPFLLFAAVIAAGCSTTEGHDRRNTAIERDESGMPVSMVEPGAEIELIMDGLGFGEGPAADEAGNVYFSDIPSSKIYRYGIDGDLILFREDTGNANGLFFERDGDIIACASTVSRIDEIHPDGSFDTIVTEHEGHPFNNLNDVWIDPAGGIYFTDPSERSESRYVFYLTPDRDDLIWCDTVTDMPNGILGTPDGSQVYVIKYHSNITYVHDVNPDGTLSEKRFFAADGYDGLTLDECGNVYLTGAWISVYAPSGEKLETIITPERPTNLCFGGADRKTLFITTPSACYKLRMRIRGAY